MFLGIVGGLGPRASAAFVSTIYDLRTEDKEADYPRVALYSDPSFPDRTDAFLAGEIAPVQRALEHALSALLDLEVTHVVVCCFTMHHIVDLLPSHLQAPLIRLTNVAAQMLQTSGDRALMCCTTGSRKLGVFERAPLWPQVRDRVVWPTDEHQDMIHELLYDLKRGLHPSVGYAEVSELCQAYGCTAAICGCSELHLVSRWFYGEHQLDTGIELIDPLWEIALTLGQEQPIAMPALAPAKVLATS